MTPREVLDFWFGGAGSWADPAKMASMETFGNQAPLWWGMTSSYGPLSDADKAAVDASCRVHADLIRAAAKGELTADEWQTTEGLYAQMLLTDQLSRNSFRGTPEAFAYDGQAMEFCRRVWADAEACRAFELCALVFMQTAGQHSENLADHDQNSLVLDFMKAKAGENGVVKMIASSQGEHREVVERFGRYPHRNAAQGRTSTPEEQAWLADWDSLPAWAKSQMPKPSGVVADAK
jgi:uncharacterized protein (DUF924 family)